MNSTSLDIASLNSHDIKFIRKELKKLYAHILQQMEGKDGQEYALYSEQLDDLTDKMNKFEDLVFKQELVR